LTNGKNNNSNLRGTGELNLFLHVVGRRPDGYHNLQTLFRFIDLSDTLHFALRQDGAVRRTNALRVCRRNWICVCVPPSYCNSKPAARWA